MRIIGNLAVLHTFRNLAKTHRWMFVLIYHCVVSLYTSIEVSTLARQSFVTPTIWDAAIDSFSRPLIFQLATVPLFVFVVADISVIGPFHETALLRSKSRGVWWLSVVGALCMVAIAFVSIQLLVLLACVVPTSTFQPRWSITLVTLYEPTYINLLQQAGSPMFVLLGVLILYLLALIAIGLTALFTSYKTQTAHIGFFAGFLVNLVGLAMYRTDLVGSQTLSVELLKFGEHASYLLMLLHGKADYAANVLLSSSLYWLAWIFTFVLLGMLANKRSDVFARGMHSSQT